MFPSVLSNLEGGQFRATFSYIATPTALYRALSKSVEVGSIRRGLETGELSESTIKQYADYVLTSLRPSAPLRFRLLLVTKKRRNRGGAEERREEKKMSRLHDLRVREPLEFDLALAALAVALECRNTSFAHEYLVQLAHLKGPELAMSTRTARLALGRRSTKKAVFWCPSQ